MSFLTGTCQEAWRSPVSRSWASVQQDSETGR